MYYLSFLGMNSVKILVFFVLLIAQQSHGRSPCSVNDTAHARNLYSHAHQVNTK